MKAQLNGLLFRVEVVVMGVLLAVLRRLRLHSSGTGDLLVAGPGGGSVGDEAMYRAFVGTGRPEVTVVVRYRSDLLVEVGARVVELPGLIYGSPLRYPASLWRFARLARSHRTVSVVGADVMDGVYSREASVRRFRTAELAAALGLDARVLGFSWNASPDGAARVAMRSASRTAQLIARDPVSRERLLADGAAAVTQAADLAFLTTVADGSGDPDLDRWMARQEADSAGLVVVNANPHLADRFPGQYEQYVELVRRLVDLGHACILLPHDSRTGNASESAYLARIAADVDRPASVWAAGVSGPGEVAAVAGRAQFVISGRMHLVVLASVGGTPAVALEYQGKMAGLYGLLGYDGRITATNFAPDALVRRGLAELAVRDDTRAVLRARLPEVERLARTNLPT